MDALRRRYPANGMWDMEMPAFLDADRRRPPEPQQESSQDATDGGVTGGRGDDVTPVTCGDRVLVVKRPRK